MTKGTGTRSGLLWEVERILNECTELPQILLMENVPQVIGEKNIADFDEWRRYLRNKGYKNYTQILNAKDFGIPQNRARCFMVSILGDYYYEFPNPIPLTLKLKDMLEENVDEKFYLSAKMIEYITSEDDSYKVSPNLLKINRDIACSKTTREGSTRADTSDYVCDSEEENIDIKQLNKPCFTDVYENIKNSSFTQASQRLQEEICSTLLSRDYKDPKCVIVNDIEYGNSRQCNQGVVSGLRIRKLTPKECWRLMGFSDEDYDKASKVNSNAQLYKQAGNSIVVNVLMAIFKEMF